MTAGRRRAGPLLRRVAPTVAVLAAMLTAPLLAAPAAAAPPAGVRALLDIPETDTLEPGPCPMEVPAEYEDRVECGVLTVPERRGEGADPERTIELPIALIESTADRPLRDPVVFPTNGGPGGSSLDALWYFLDYADWATSEHDVILIEQRGDRWSDPSLDCPELDTTEFVRDGRLLSGAAYDDARARAVTACHDRLIEEGVDLSAYTSAASAADLVDLRTAMGYDSWNLYGISYGARLALTMMRDHPEGLRAVVLDGTYPPNVDSVELHPAGLVGAVDRLVADCEADADCSARYPRLAASLETALDAAAADPIEVTVRGPDGSPVTMQLDDSDLAWGLFDAFYDAGTIGVLPFVIDRLAQGDTGPLLPLAQRDLDRRDVFTEGLRLSIECAEEVPFATEEEIAAGYALSPLTEHLQPHSLLTDCPNWEVPALSELEAQAVTSDIPTLLTVGGYDPITPPAWSEAAAATLSAHRLYVFPPMGHGAVWQSWIDDCPASIAKQFLADPIAEPDASCIDSMASPDFLTGSDIHPTSAIYRLDADVLQGREPAQQWFAIGALGVFVLTLVYAAVYGVLRAARRTDEAAPGTVLAATTTSGFFLLFAGALAYILFTTNPLVLGFGIPPAAWLVFLLPLVALALAVLLTVLLVIAWVRDDGSTAHRVVFSITAGVALAFGIWLLARGLLFV